MTAVRAGLPPMPPGIEKLRVDDRGYPVPYFAAWVSDSGAPRTRGYHDARPEFRLLYPGVIGDCVDHGLCWVCGQPLGRYGAFVAGPMCGVNRTSAEPPSHIACARWAAQACPFLTLPKAQRREAGLGETVAPAGIMLRRNPGVAMVWIVREGARLFPDESGGVLFHIGEPRKVEWYAEGRPATRDEVERSVVSGLDSLEQLCQSDDDKAELGRLLAALTAYYPEPLCAPQP